MSIVMPESYNFNLSCENCSQTTQLRIPLGITVLNYAVDKECPHCGCKMAGSGENRAYQIPRIFVPVGIPLGFRK